MTDTLDGVVKKVLFLGLPLEANCGVSKAQLELADALQGQGVEVDHLSAWFGQQDHPLTTNNNENHRFDTLDAFLDYIKRSNIDYDVIHLHDHSWSPAVLPSGGVELVKRELNRGVVYTFHSYMPHEHEAQRATLQSADRIIQLTSQGESAFHEIFQDPSFLSRVRVIPNLVSTPDCKDEEVTHLREKLSPNGETILLYVGRLSDEKGTTELGYALKELTKKQEKIKLVVVGEGNNLYLSPSTINAQAAMTEAFGDSCHHSMIFTGWLPEEEVAIYQRAADLQIVPSHFESFGLAAAKGLLSGCPLAVSDIPTLRGIYHLGTQEPYAIKISPVSAEGIVDAVTYFMQNREAVLEMTARGQEAMGSEYSPANIARRHIELYRETGSAYRLHSLIQKKAHEIYTQHDGAPGNPLDDWRKAEEIVRQHLRK